MGSGKCWRNLVLSMKPPKMMCHIECNSNDVLIRVPFEVAKKFAETDEEFKEYFNRAKKRHEERK